MRGGVSWRLAEEFVDEVVDLFGRDVTAGAGGDGADVVFDNYGLGSAGAEVFECGLDEVGVGVEDYGIDHETILGVELSEVGWSGSWLEELGGDRR